MYFQASLFCRAVLEPHLILIAPPAWPEASEPLWGAVRNQKVPNSPAWRRFRGRIFTLPETIRQQKYTPGSHGWLEDDPSFPFGGWLIFRGLCFISGRGACWVDPGQKWINFYIVAFSYLVGIPESTKKLEQSHHSTGKNFAMAALQFFVVVVGNANQKKKTCFSVWKDS